MIKKIKIISVFFLLFVFIGFVKVEGATIAVAPLVNAAVFENAEEEKVPGQLYTAVAIDTIHNKPGYILMENDRLRYAMKVNTTENELPTKEQMQTISKKANVDIIVAMKLTNYGRKMAQRSVHEVNCQMDVKAELAFYNRLTGKYIMRNCKDDSIYDATLESRYDKVKEAWIKLLKREFNRITEQNKKRA